jgi:hypothetical protein
VIALMVKETDLPFNCSAYRYLVPSMILALIARCPPLLLLC